MFYLESDLTAYNKLLHNAVSWDNIGALGMQAIGTTCMYVVGMLAGAKVLSMVPEVCSWLIPGGVASGTGSAASGVATAATMTGVGAAAAAAGAAGGAVVGGTLGTASMAGAYSQNRGEGKSVSSSVVGSVISNTMLGQHYATGGDRARSYNNVGKNDENYKRKDDQ